MIKPHRNKLLNKLTSLEYILVRNFISLWERPDFPDRASQLVQSKDNSLTERYC